jgi:nucleoside-diphosphate-sugar epimerase
VSSSHAVPSTRADTILFGGSGFFGTHILKRHPQMISVGRTAPATGNRHIQIESLADLRALRDVRFDKVIYLIGHSDNHGMEKETLGPGEPSAFDYHLYPTIKVLEQLKEYPITKLIHFSTILLYDPTRIILPVSETAPIDPYRTRYVLSKHMSEEACNFYSAWIPIINVRVSNTYGPTRLKRFDLINDLIHQVLETGRASVRSTKPWRDFIHVEDVANAVAKLLDSDYTGTLNLGTGTMTQVRSVVDLLRELSGSEIEDQDHELSGPMRFQCDMTTVSRIIDWKPRYSVSEGIEQTYSLMKSWAAS